MKIKMTVELDDRTIVVSQDFAEDRKMCDVIQAGTEAAINEVATSAKRALGVTR